MIHKLKGIVESAGEALAVIDVGGVGYGVYCPTPLLGLLERGAAAELFVETHISEQAAALYGFGSASDKELFNLLLSVQGVGPKAGLAILSAMSAHDIAKAVAGGDEKAFACAKGIGPKTAARIIAELKSKIAKLEIAGAGDGAPGIGNQTAADAISALVNLGIPRPEAEDAVRQAFAAAPEADLNSLIKSALSRRLG